MGFLELRRQCGVSHEVRRGAQGSSRVAPGKSGPHEMARGSSSLLSSHGRVIGSFCLFTHTDTCAQRGTFGKEGESLFLKPLGVAGGTHKSVCWRFTLKKSKRGISLGVNASVPFLK